MVGRTLSLLGQFNIAFFLLCSIYVLQIIKYKNKRIKIFFDMFTQGKGEGEFELVISAL
jgi:hypothetical protein